jgi:nucleoside-diphosphate-sugar epimerase
MSEDLVLVTGGSGFIGVYCIDQLLRAGYRVRTSVRSLSREADVRSMLNKAETPRQEALSFVAADLAQDAGWAEAVAGCRFVQHVASPLPSAVPKHEDDVIVPARQGTLRVLRAARDAGVERVVVTSSFGAVGYGHKPQAAPFDETSWTNLDNPDLTAYVKSKTLAEQAAWNFMRSEGGKLELTVVNPVAVFGPVLSPDFSTSVLIIKKLLDGFPFCPRIYFATVDVRDVADIHLRAMTNPAAKGQRFLAAAGGLVSILDVANILRQGMGAAARRAPKGELPDWLVRRMAPFVSELKLIVSELGKKKYVSNEKAKRILGWTPRSNEDVVLSAGESLVRLGLVKS